MKILMVEDNQTLCEMMAMFFKREKWEAGYAQDGIKAVEMFKKDPTGWDIVLLDLNLPKMDGMQVAAEIRKISPTVPIIMLTARDSESDQVLGLEMGADEYVTKPFSTIALIARIKALYRRTQLNQLSSSTQQIASDFDVQTPHFKLNSKTREAFLDDQQIENLTPKEFDLLKTNQNRYLPENSCYSWSGTMNTMVMNERLTHTSKSCVKRLKRPVPKLFKRYGALAINLMTARLKINEADLPADAELFCRHLHTADHCNHLIYQRY